MPTHQLVALDQANAQLRETGLVWDAASSAVQYSLAPADPADIVNKAYVDGQAASLPPAPASTTSYLSTNAAGALAWSDPRIDLITQHPAAGTNQYIEASDPADVPLTLRAMAGGSASTFQIEDDSGAVLTEFKATGAIWSYAEGDTNNYIAVGQAGGIPAITIATDEASFSGPTGIALKDATDTFSITGGDDIGAYYAVALRTEGGHGIKFGRAARDIIAPTGPSTRFGNNSNRWGTIYSDSVLNTSDRELKKDIAPSAYGLDFIRSLQPMQYRMRSEDDDAPLHLGLIAQDMARWEPELFLVDMTPKEDRDGNPAEGHDWSLSYAELIAPLVKAVQELSAEVSALKAAAAST